MIVGQALAGGDDDMAAGGLARAGERIDERVADGGEGAVGEGADVTEIVFGRVLSKEPSVVERVSD